MNLFETVENSVTVKQAAEHYGCKVNRSHEAMYEEPKCCAVSTIPRKISNIAELMKLAVLTDWFDAMVNALVSPGPMDTRKGAIINQRAETGQLRHSKIRPV